jgi:hypothetical protein
MLTMTDHGNSIKNTADRHAFVLAGRETLFLCHMSMVDEMENHMYQLVARVKIPSANMNRYREEYDKNNEDDTFFLVNTEENPIRILDLVNGGTSSFRAAVWSRAHVTEEREPPWGDIEPFIPHTTVTVERVVYFRHIDLNLNRPQSLSYVIFGLGSEAHLHHYLTRQPEFDHVVSLAEPPAWLPDDQLEAGVPINFPALLENGPVCCSPLKPGSTHAVQYCGIETPMTHAHEPDEFVVTIGRELWFNTSIVNSENPCAPPASPEP